MNRYGIRAAALLLALILVLPALPARGMEIPSAPTTDAQIRAILSGMTVEQKLAQMMIVAFRSDESNTYTAKEITSDYAALLERYDFGGVILYTGNMTDTAQTVRMIRDCQAAAFRSEPRIPLLVCVDQEGGYITRLSFGTTGAGNMCLAATGDPKLTEEQAGIFGREIRALGFNMDLAPVSDVNNNPANPVIGVRSFSDDPALTAAHVTAFLEGLRSNGVMAAIKHFPGHGNVDEDSHTHLPLSTLTVDELKACELVPFQAGIAAGADIIMTAHIQYPNIEAQTYFSIKDGRPVYLPATLSRRIITGVLREELGYDGIVMTDAMGMDAIAAHFNAGDAAALAINAGIDILLCPVELYNGNGINTFPKLDAYIQDLATRVKFGEIREEQLNASVTRILKLKIKYGLYENALPGTEEAQIAAAKATVGAPEHHRREWAIAQRGLTLLRNNGALPIDGSAPGRTLILYPTESRRPTVDYALRRLRAEGLLGEGHQVTCISYASMVTISDRLQKALQQADRVLILSQSTERKPVLAAVLKQAGADPHVRTALLSLNLPFDAALYPDADAVLCAFQTYGGAHDEAGEGPFNLNVAVALCAAFGQTVPQGTLPVSIPRTISQPAAGLLYQRGFGLTNWGKSGQ